MSVFIYNNYSVVHRRDRLESLVSRFLSLAPLLMADELIDPRIDATATVLWKRLKHGELATPAEQVILDNLAEIPS
jgi:hypothetical protein